MTGNTPRETRARAAARVSAPTGATGANHPIRSETESGEMVRSTTRVLRQSFEEAMRQRREVARRNMVAVLDTPVRLAMQIGVGTVRGPSRVGGLAILLGDPGVSLLQNSSSFYRPHMTRRRSFLIPPCGVSRPGGWACPCAAALAPGMRDSVDDSCKVVGK
jgi:hypothetical protein